MRGTIIELTFCEIFAWISQCKLVLPENQFVTLLNIKIGETSLSIPLNKLNELVSYDVYIS